MDRKSNIKEFNLKQNIKPLIEWFGDHPTFFLTLFLTIGFLIGLLYEVTFYQHFNINIFHYIKPGDFIFSWTRDIIYVSILVSIIILVSFIIIGTTTSHIFTPKTIKLLTLISFVAFFSFSLVSSVLWSTLYWNNLMIILFIMSVIGGYLIGLDLPLRNFEMSKSFKFVFLAFLLSAIFIMPIFRANIKYKWIVNGKAEKFKFNFSSKNKLLNEQHKYSIIGSTSDFKFIYDLNTKECLVVNKSQIAVIKKIKDDKKETNGQ